MQTPLPQFQPNYLSLEYIFSRIYNWFSTTFVSIHTATGGNFVHTIKNISAFLCILLLAVIFYCWIRLYEMKEGKDMQAKLEKEAKEKEILFPSAGPKNEQWERTVDHFNSTNPSEWRLAIIEANTILERLVEGLPMTGVTVGEKLKSADISDFRTVTYAREANYIRNRIAHDGLDFTLDAREANRVMNLYKAVFEEFGLI
jgi:hypothetical protein